MNGEFEQRRNGYVDAIGAKRRRQHQAISDSDLALAYKCGAEDAVELIGKAFAEFFGEKIFRWGDTNE